MRRELVLEICLVSLKKCQFAIMYLAFKSGDVTAGDMHAFNMDVCICVNMYYIYTYVHMHLYTSIDAHTYTYTKITCNFMPLTERI